MQSIPRWINKKVPLYSTGNYIQYPGTNHNGKDYEKEWVCVCVCVCVCVTESACCTEEIKHNVVNQL